MTSEPSVFKANPTKVAFQVLRGHPPNRICFATTHAGALTENSGRFAEETPYKFKIPFANGVLLEFHKSTGIPLRKNEFGYWTPLTGPEADRVREWMTQQDTRVYLKDFYECSIALGERTVDKKETELGALFSAAKYGEDADAAREVARRMHQTVGAMVSLPKFGAISHPPPRAGKGYDLPTFLAQRLAKKLGLRYLEMGTWNGPKGQLKGVEADKKWDALDQVGFAVNPALIKVGPVLVLDDIYQSGTTINFLRSKLAGAGVNHSCAITIVKAARDTDNQ